MGDELLKGWNVFYVGVKCQEAGLKIMGETMLSV